MAIIKANNFDITKYSDEVQFVIDTNILYFVHSGYYLPTDRKRTVYSNLLQKILSGDRKIIVSALSLQELLFGVENKEYLLYLAAHGITDKRTYTKKDFRRNQKERSKLKSKMQTILSEITTAYKLSDGDIKGVQVVHFVDDLLSYKYDPIDYVLVDNYLAQSSTVFISDDTDFQYDSRINIVTA
ncbi:MULTISPECIES: hypothetical protein [Caproicibacterium]|uniref:PIN domain-containing protein n=1 Tax=Caproicibacterium argilliputei TaxID=3030016 RepID=A0AA97D989_9FIRM|nr:hypothetical protein [Caproicibacterium argilliputei]WOC31649.1 hypothetical protein PXC00_10570 [Caproicibacterium argilliputei]